jgi:flagellar motor switch protein FliM
MTTKPLSQEEVDVLLEVGNQVAPDARQDEMSLEAFSSLIGADKERRINPYNFKRPRLFSQDQMRLLNYVHESFARDLSVYLSAQLRTIVDINLIAIDQVLYSEYVMSSAPPSALYVVGIQDMDHRTVFELDPRLVIYMIEKLFGGPGAFPRKPRELSQIERRIMSKLMIRVLSELEKAWKQVHPLRMRETSFEPNAELVQIIPGVEPVLVGTFDVSIYDQHSFINLCYPYLLLEQVMGRTGIQQWFSSTVTQVDAEVRGRYEDALKITTTELRAELGRARVSVSDLMNLAVGDIIPLHHRTTEPIQVFVDNKETFRASTGKVGKRRALRIMEVVNLPQTEQENGFA